MTTEVEDRLLELAVVALLTTISGELAGVTAVVSLGVTTFAFALAALLVVMTLSLVVGLSRLSGPDMQPVTSTDRTH
ncbi:hypothetical protein [Halonotius pteroides]|uniref:Uncharacterized protein n=1 Tax=Halonotius pteroides TaxID=268735 RepID=A0A3A6QHV3_9EURY|nr:hypothetical protein [Halonotius pteroides]RJX51957.1 hypothetical protein DP106_01200 [Halonotius pteroides]